MNLEEQIRDDLQRSPLPATLVPPPDLADTVLRRARRGRSFRAALTSVVTAVAVAFAVPVAAGTWTGGGSPSEPTFPAPGGGPTVIHAYTRMSDETTYLLDAASGRYRHLNVRVVLAPDLRQAAVVRDGRVGLVDRDALLREGDDAVRWLDLPPGNGLAWSPDGTALVITSLSKDEDAGVVRFTAHRYDLATGAVTDTPIPVDMVGGAVGWAADSQRYVALLPGDRTADTVQPGALQYIGRDGTLGPRVEIAGGLVGGAGSYSPSRRLMLVDASGLMALGPVHSKVVEVDSGRVVASLPPGARPIGWYDEDTVAVLAPGWHEEPELEVVDVRTGTVTKRVDLAGLPLPALGENAIQIGSSAGLSGSAAAFGF